MLWDHFNGFINVLMLLSRSVLRPFWWWDCTLNNTLIDWLFIHFFVDDNSSYSGGVNDRVCFCMCVCVCVFVYLKKYAYVCVCACVYVLLYYCAMLISCWAPLAGWKNSSHAGAYCNATTEHRWYHTLVSQGSLTCVTLSEGINYRSGYTLQCVEAVSLTHTHPHLYAHTQAHTYPKYFVIWQQYRTFHSYCKCLRVCVGVCLRVCLGLRVCI